LFAIAVTWAVALFASVVLALLPIIMGLGTFLIVAGFGWLAIKMFKLKDKDFSDPPE